MPFLTLILFLPWFSIISGLFYFFPKQPRNSRRKVIDSIAIVLALIASCIAMKYGFDAGAADIKTGFIWRQVLAVLYGYGAFLGIMTVAIFIRPKLWKISA